MINKLYEQTKKFIKETYKLLLLYIIMFMVLTWPLPYYIYTGGGTINVNSKVTVEDQTTSKGSFNLAYVSERRATIPTLLLSYIIPSWEKFPLNEMKLTDDESMEDVTIRDRLYLADANQNATSIAYKRAGKEYTIHEEKNYVTYIMKDAISSLKVGDILLKADDKDIKDITDIQNIVANRNVGDEIKLIIERKGKKETASLTIREVEGKKLGGISLLKKVEYETNPKLTLAFNSNESGPSGGLLLSLAIYDKLIPEDLTNGRQVVGTGTIDDKGNVGSIGGVSYKLKGAVSKHADIFLVPSGENYEECINLQKKYNYKIKIIGVSTFDEAILALKS